MTPSLAATTAGLNSQTERKFEKLPSRLQRTSLPDLAEVLGQLLAAGETNIKALKAELARRGHEWSEKRIRSRRKELGYAWADAAAP